MSRVTITKGLRELEDDAKEAMQQIDTPIARARRGSGAARHLGKDGCSGRSVQRRRGGAARRRPEHGKYLVGTVVGRPGISGLHVGFSGLHGGASSTADPVRRRFGADVQYARRNLVVRSEFVTGTDGDIPRRGHYEYVGFKPVPAFELTLRHDVGDPDRRKDSSIADALTRDDLLGFNYFLQDHYAKVQVNVTRRTFQSAALRPAILLNLGVQTAW